MSACVRFHSSMICHGNRVVYVGHARSQQWRLRSHRVLRVGNSTAVDIRHRSLRSPPTTSSATLSSKHPQRGQQKIHFHPCVAFSGYLEDEERSGEGSARPSHPSACFETVSYYASFQRSKSIGLGFIPVSMNFLLYALPVYPLYFGLGAALKSCR